MIISWNIDVRCIYLCSNFIIKPLNTLKKMKIKAPKSMFNTYVLCKRDPKFMAD